MQTCAMRGAVLARCWASARGARLGSSVTVSVAAHGRARAAVPSWNVAAPAPFRTKRTGLHPRAYPYTMVLSDGSTVKAWSSCPETPKVVRLQEDIKNQVPFVLETGNIIDLTGNVARFERRFNSDVRGKDTEGDAEPVRAPWEVDDDDEDDDGW
eukprot:m.416472 g.416472  ORF g.416472 m.416472 type:complete len:155 (+) comp29990_c0_seq1:236-700(+)